MPPVAGSELSLVVFPSDLGWMALLGSASAGARALVFGYRNSAEAVAALDRHGAAQARLQNWNPDLVDALTRYAEGDRVEFDHEHVEYGPSTNFRSRVLDACRGLAYGDSISYAELAVVAGSVGAARAVGNVMASNTLPLIIPCHRVLASGGRLGGFSMPSGTAMKQRLLEMEARGCSRMTIDRRAMPATKRRARI